MDKQTGVSFHPLKAGRRLLQKDICESCYESFHPLKAGRRLSPRHEQGAVPSVSIPSRRVGDQNLCIKVSLDRHRFHPLKAGRRQVLTNKVPWEKVLVSIPSRRVGDVSITER